MMKCLEDEYLLWDTIWLKMSSAQLLWDRKKNKVPYNIFQKWFKDTRKKVVEVQVDGAPKITHGEGSKAGDQPGPVSKSSTDHPVHIWIDIRISNGLHLSQKNLSYQDLIRMVEKLEGLC